MVERTQTISFRLTSSYLAKLDERGERDGIKSLHEVARRVVCEALDCDADASLLGELKQDLQAVVERLNDLKPGEQSPETLDHLTLIRGEIAAVGKALERMAGATLEATRLIESESKEAQALRETLGERFNDLETLIRQFQSQTANAFEIFIQSAQRKGA